MQHNHDEEVASGERQDTHEWGTVGSHSDSIITAAGRSCKKAVQILD